MTTINSLLDLLAEHGGEIISSASLNTYNIEQARASDRMYVRDDSLGFVWMPPIEIATDEKCVELFERWFPLRAEIPDYLKKPDWLFKRLKEEQRKNRKENPFDLNDAAKIQKIFFKNKQAQ